MSKLMLIATGKACFFLFTPFTMAKHHFWERLVKIRKTSQGLRREVAKILLTGTFGKTDTDVCRFLCTLKDRGFAFGMGSGLVAKRDTKVLFRRYHAEIEQLRSDVEICLGEPLRIPHVYHDLLVWFALDTVTRSILVNELGIEL